MGKEVRDVRLARTVLGSARNNNYAAKRLRSLRRTLYQVKLGSGRPGKIFGTCFWDALSKLMCFEEVEE